MTRTLWWALAVAALASGASYDYSESKMPDYGGAIDYDGPRDSPVAPRADDYHEHTRDVPAPAEYKYEENRGSGKADKRVIEVGEPVEWQDSSKKQKKYSSGENQETFDNYNSDEFTSNYKSDHRTSTRRTRLKQKSIHNEGLVREIDEPRSKVGYNRNRKKAYRDRKDNIDGRGDEFEDDKEVDFEEENADFRSNRRKSGRETTLRYARRKPRDRYVKPEPELDEEDPIENLRRRPIKEEFRPETATHNVMRRPQYRQEVDVRAKDGNEKITDKFGSKKYDEYSEYYDMKRVHGIKEKLLKGNRAPYTATRPHLLQRMWPQAGIKRYPDDGDGVEGLRRLMDPHSYSAVYDDETQEKRVDELVSREKYTTSTYNLNTIGLPPFTPSRRAMSLEMSTPSIIETTTIADIPSRTTTRMVPSTTTITYITTKITSETTKITEAEDLTTPGIEEELEIPKQNTTELSLAEKSRLSILKKAQRKEMVKGSGTKKPPVLLQVTNVLHTLVMVEPPTSMMPWQRVSVVHEDTPDNVVKVKRLMRKKLVDNAKDVHDLAENWDDMICDYIDMALVEAKAASFKTSYSMRLMLFSFVAITLL